MGANVTRKGFIGWLDGLQNYTMNGLFAPFDYRDVDYSKPNQNDCNSIVQWQDSAGGFVTRAPVTNCVVSNWIPTPAVDDGS
jgi:hypothetical protein